jgi:hypothetical protein
MADDDEPVGTVTSEPPPEASEVDVDWLSPSALIPDSPSSAGPSATELNTAFDLEDALGDPFPASVLAREASKPGLFTPLRPKPRADSFWTYGSKWIALVAVIIGLGFWNAYRSVETGTGEEAPSPERPTVDGAGGTAAEVAGVTPNAMVASTAFDGRTATLNIRSVPTNADVVISDGDGSSYGRCRTPCVADVPFHDGAEATNRIVLEFHIEGYQMLRLERHLFGIAPLSLVGLPTPAKAER